MKFEIYENEALLSVVSGNEIGLFFCGELKKATVRSSVKLMPMELRMGCLLIQDCAVGTYSLLSGGLKRQSNPARNLFLAGILPTVLPS